MMQDLEEPAVKGINALMDLTGGEGLGRKYGGKLGREGLGWGVC